MATPFASPAVGAARVQPFTVLLVEDDLEVRAVARRVLTRATIRVLEAGTGLEALRLWRAHAGSVDVLLTDLHLPEVAGDAVAAHARADRPDLPVVLMSGYAPDPSLPALGAGHATTQLLAKPFSADELLAALGRVLRLPRAAGAATVEQGTLGALAYEYRLNAEDRITSFDSAWADFAASNGTPALAGSVVGTPIWRHITDPTTRHLYELLFRKARDHAQEVRVPFRCDAPTLVREMELRIAPLGERGLRMTAHVVRQRPRPYVPFLDPGIPRTSAFVRMCGWCKRVMLEGCWRELEDAMQASGLLCEAPMPEVSHGMCEECEAVVLALLDREDACNDAHANGSQPAAVRGGPV